MACDWADLRTSFNEDAALYDTARPGYPKQLFDDIVALSGIPVGGRIIEVGCGTGQATLPLARAGYQITALDLGAEMAAVARRKLAGYPNVQVLVGAFEHFPFEPGGFDLLTSATAFHWVDPAVRYDRAAEALRPDGAVALFWNQHVHSDASGDFFEEVQRLYERFAPESARGSTGLPRPGDADTGEAERLVQSGLFGPACVRRYPWEQAYDAAGYIAVLNTYSGHRRLPEAQRGGLIQGIADLIDTRYGGRIVKGYQSILYIARRKAG
jgi:SAM-dependent methyltransferase